MIRQHYASCNMDSSLSSPDPLQDSLTYRSPAKTRRQPRARSSLPLEESSPTKQTFELDVGNQLSPQKIRVTVEAGNSDTENAYTHFVNNDPTSPTPAKLPMNRRRERTTTTTVPVKGLSDSEDNAHATPKRGRGRPKKSAGTPVKSKSRTSTPTQKPKARKSIGNLVDGDDENDLNFLLGHGVEVGRGKGRSRSRSTKGASQKSTPAPRSESLEIIGSSTTSKKDRGRRKTLMPDEVVVLEDAMSDENIEIRSLGSKEAHGELSSADDNGANTEFFRSTADPGNETPRPTASPRRVVAPRPNQNSQTRTYPSPSVSPEKTHQSSYEGDSMAMMQAEQTEMGSSLQNQETEDGPDEYREYDTILESEGFSMISVDSVPSLREHISSPANQDQEQESQNAPMNKNVSTVQKAAVAGRDDSFSSIPEEILLAATPGRERVNPKLMSVRSTAADDSFSNIPPHMLEATTREGKSETLNSSSSSHNSEARNAGSSGSGMLVPTFPNRELPNAIPSPAHSLIGDPYEDSFSAIPSAILEAATPAPERKVLLSTSIVARPSTVPNTSNASGSIQSRSPTQQNGQGGTSKRLPTPEDTPSPGEADNAQSSAPSDKTLAATIAPDLAAYNTGNDSSIVSQMKSSPPSIVPRRYTYTAHLRQQRDFFPDKTQTPSIVFSSPLLPPPILFARGQPVFTSDPTEAQRPKLSPIVRAGRALQGITIPSSPRSRAQSLGSPFKSPIAERKLSSSKIRRYIGPRREQYALILFLGLT